MRFPTDWHHVSMLLESEHPSNRTRRREQHLPDVLCAAGSPQKASSFYSCDVVVLQRCTLLLVPWNDSPSHCSTCKIPSTTAQHVCKREREGGGGVLHAFYRQTTVLWLRTKKDPCTIHKVGCNGKKKGRHRRLFKYESEDCSDGIGSSFYKLFSFSSSQVFPATVALAQMLKRSHEKTELQLEGKFILRQSL